jgi:hypothetical protein
VVALAANLALLFASLDPTLTMATNGTTDHAPNGYVIKILNGEPVRVPYVPPRRKPGQDEDEEAGAEIRLGPDFQDAHALSVSEARLIVERTEEVRKKTGKKLRETECVHLRPRRQIWRTVTDSVAVT